MADRNRTESRCVTGWRTSVTALVTPWGSLSVSGRVGRRAVDALEVLLGQSRGVTVGKGLHHRFPTRPRRVGLAGLRVGAPALEVRVGHGARGAMVLQHQPVGVDRLAPFVLLVIGFAD